MGRFVTTLHRSVGRDVDRVERTHPHPVSNVSSDAMSSTSLQGSESLISPSDAFGARWLVPMVFGGAGAKPPPATLLHDPLVYPPEDLEPAVRSTLPEVEDRRYYHPAGNAPSRTVRGSTVRSKVAQAKPGRLWDIPAGLAVEAKAAVIFCIRRKMRRGVILALGQGGGYHRKPRRSPKSDLWC